MIQLSSMFPNQEMLKARTGELKSHRYTTAVDLFPLAAMNQPTDGREPIVDVPEFVQELELQKDDVFRGRDRYLWIQKTLRVPPPKEGCGIIGVFDFGLTGDGNNRGFESLMYIDGAPWQGVDGNHTEVSLDQFAGKIVELTFLLWTGLEGGGPKKEQAHRLKQAEIAYLHLATDEFYYLSKAISETLGLVEDNVPQRHRMEQALLSAYNLIAWEEDRFGQTVDAALATLKTELAAIPKLTDVTVSAVGHTHIDVAWLWRLKHTREKAIRSFSTVLRLMEEFDDYSFLQSQPQLYRYVKRDCPALYERIKAAVKSGRWEADGGMWVEADCNISSGEALVRQFTHGIRFFKQEFGVDCEYLWLPDVFGYSWALPQILKQCNIKTFMTTKISWNQYNSIPHDLFWWRGIDGSEVLTYFITTPGPDEAFDIRISTYNGRVNPHAVIGSWTKFKDKQLSSETLLSYGYGDGGGGPNREMLEMRRVMDSLPCLPHVKPSRAGDFFRRIHDKVEAAQGYVHTWDGELYLEYHRGTYTSQGYSKMMNRRLEFLAARCEWLASLAWLNGQAYPQDSLYDAWECILLHQFHDIIPGSSIREVYEDSRAAYGKTENDLLALEQTLLGTMTEDAENTYTLFNPSSFASAGPVFIPGEGEGVFGGMDGLALPTQRSEGGWWVEAGVPGMSMRSIQFIPSQAREDESWFSADLARRQIETPFYRISWDNQGKLTSLWDKTNQREALAGYGNALEVYEDKPLAHDNWDIDLYYLQKPCEFFTPSGEPAITSRGSVCVSLRFCYRYHHSTLTQDMKLYRNNRRIDFVTQVDWREEHRLLRAAFKVDVRATKATYDIQFGHVERPTHFNTSWDYARFEVVAHKWADLSDSGYGVSLLNDCKYGHSVRDNEMRLTLLKSGKYPDTEADMGRHSFTYSLLPHEGTVTQAQTIEQSHALNNPVKWVKGRLAPPVNTLLSLPGGDVVIDAVKKAYDDDCLVVRVHECRGKQTPVSVTSPRTIKAYAACNMLEEQQEAQRQSDTVTAVLRPFESKTWKIWL